MCRRRVAEIEESIYIGKNKTDYVHYITKSEKIDLDGLVIRDFCESNKPSLNKKIDLFVEYSENN